MFSIMPAIKLKPKSKKIFANQRKTSLFFNLRKRGPFCTSFIVLLAFAACCSSTNARSSHDLQRINWANYVPPPPPNFFDGTYQDGDDNTRPKASNIENNGELKEKTKETQVPKSVGTAIK